MPQFRDPSEELEYQYVVESNPKRPEENAMEYLERINELVRQGAGTGKTPKQVTPWLPYKDE